ncbi:MAG: 4Fe-4S binding protein [Promethearchaeota archaeon]
MFPRIKCDIEKDKVKTEVRFVTGRVGLEIDESKCQGCGICVKICPVSALGRGPVGDAKRDQNSLESVIPTVVEPEKCSYCGLCGYMCPWNAITLVKDGEPIPLEKLDIVEKHAVPQLDYTMKTCKEGVPDAKSYLEGDIEFISENCAGGCNTCVEVCPTNAISIVKEDTPWDKGRKLVVDKDKCILCGTCTNACPVYDAIKLKITNVKSKGEYNAIFWDKIVEQLKISRMRGGRKIN